MQLFKHGFNLGVRQFAVILRVEPAVSPVALEHLFPQLCIAGDQRLPDGPFIGAHKVHPPGPGEIHPVQIVLPAALIKMLGICQHPVHIKNNALYHSFSLPQPGGPVLPPNKKGEGAADSRPPRGGLVLDNL